MKIEFLYPELNNLYGDYYNIKYLAACIDGAELIATSNDEEPAFVSQQVDVIYIGSMSERNQEFAIQHLLPYKDRVKELIESGTIVLATGNGLEIFGSHIEDDGKRIECLGALNCYAVRQMNDRRNCFFLGTFEDMKIVGHKGQFSFSHGMEQYPFIHVTGGFGINLSSETEGIHYRNFFGTYLLGPFLLLNPYFVKHLLSLLGVSQTLLHEKEIVEAYQFRLQELERPGREFMLGAE